MKNTIKAAAGLSMLAVSNLALANRFDSSTDSKALTNVDASEGSDLVGTITTWINTAMGFLALLAIIYGLYGGFKILTAGGNEDNVKQGKDIIVRAGLGLIVIFSVGMIVRFVMSFLFSN